MCVCVCVYISDALRVVMFTKVKGCPRGVMV